MSFFSFICLSTFLLFALNVGFLYAQEKEPKENSKTPWEIFQFGFSAYKNGNKDKAIQAYSDAAEQGQIAATWKLAHMYAQGDGVIQDHYIAYQFFSQVIRQQIEPGNPDESYIAQSLVEVGRYLKNGIPNSPVLADPVSAAEYFKKAAVYGNPSGQFEVGKMYLLDSKIFSNKNYQKQASRWLKLAASKGHQGAQALLGSLLFEKGDVVEGLAMMTAALAKAKPSDQLWIQAIQEKAFAITKEENRRRAINRAEVLTFDSDAILK